MLHAPTAIGAVEHRPDPEERPNRVQREEAHPPSSVDGILMRMTTVLRDLVGHVVDRDDAVEERDEHEKQEAEREVIEEGVEVDVAGDEQIDAGENEQDENGLRPPSTC